MTSAEQSSISSHAQNVRTSPTILLGSVNPSNGSRILDYLKNVPPLYRAERILTSVAGLGAPGRQWPLDSSSSQRICRRAEHIATAATRSIVAIMVKGGVGRERFPPSFVFVFPWLAPGRYSRSSRGRWQTVPEVHTQRSIQGCIANPVTVSELSSMPSI